MSNVHTKEWYENYANENGLVLGKIADRIIERLKETDGYCPCKVALWQKTRPDELNRIVCPCEEHTQEINETGHCHCCLFFKKND